MEKQEKKNDLKNDFQNINKAPNKSKFVPKSDKNLVKGPSKPIQCYECQGHGHTTTKCTNWKEKIKGKALDISWENDYEEECSEPESPSRESGRCVAFMVLSNPSFMQGSFDRDSKSDEDIDLQDFSNNEQDKKAEYMRLL